MAPPSVCPTPPKTSALIPNPAAQKPGCGFPLLKLVGVFSLATGALLDYAKGNKHQHELNLLQKLLDQFKAGDLVLADRGFNSYTLLALLLLRGVARSVSPASAPAGRFAQRQTPGQKRPADGLAQTLAVAASALSAPGHLETHSRRNSRSGWCASPWPCRDFARNR